MSELPEHSEQRPNESPVQSEVQDRFGVLPNFFRLAPETPEITSSLWGFAKFGYLDNPLPSLFKERLFVFMSRFCDVRYCIGRHVGFLIGLGHPAGDRQASPQLLDDVLRLLRRPFPRGAALAPHLAALRALNAPLAEMPATDSALEEAILVAATHVFLQTPQATAALDALRHTFDPALFQHLLTFLAFVRTAHFWTKVHPELAFEEDLTELLAVHEGLADCVLNDPEAATSETSQVLLHELAALREESKHAALLRVTLASIGDAVITTDVEGRITNLNAVAESLTGWRNQEAQGHVLDDVFCIVNEDTRRPVENPAVRALRKGVIVGLANHTLLIAKDGSERPIDDSAAPIRGTGGEILGCVLVFRDVSGRRQAERALQEREQQYRLVGQVANDAIWDWNLVTNEVTWNEGVQSNFGFAPREVLSDASWWINHIHPEDRDRISQGIHAAIEGRHEVWQDEYRFLRADGSYADVFDRGKIVRDASGVGVRMVGAMLDLSERKRAQEALRDSEERLRLALEAAELGAWNIDPQTNSMTADERFQMIFSGKVGPIDYEQAFALIHPDDRERVREAVAASVRPIDPAPYAEEYRVVHPETNEVRWVLGKGRANFEGHGADRRLSSFDGTVADITERRRMENDLRQLADNLSEADRRKDEFLATLAHELRNPLAPIRTGLEIMKLVKDDPAKTEQIRGTMERQVLQMVRLIDDLLEVSRITQGKLELRKCEVTFADVIESAVEATQPLIDERNHKLTVKLPTAALVLDADPNRLAQVFSNLINNSAKYTPEGGHIELHADQHDGQVVVKLKDSGIGIPPELRDKIFEMFVQIDHPMEKGYKGLGIGLTLVKRIIEMHDGTISVSSEGAGRGTEFTVHLPIAKVLSVPPAPRAAEPLPAPAKLRILVVDDNSDAATLLSLVVKMLGSEVHLASDGLQAIRAAEQLLPDVVLMDIGMPRMNGYEAARHIRQQPWGSQMVLVALTGWGQNEDKQRAIDAGFNHHLVKPAEPAELQRMLATIQRPRASDR